MERSFLGFEGATGTLYHPLTGCMDPGLLLISSYNLKLVFPQKIDFLDLSISFAICVCLILD